MSAQDTAEEDGDDGPGRREVAHRVFAAEYDDATRSYQEGDEERAPTYVVTPSGAKANRLFLVGVLTEVEQVNDQMLRARVVDPTGAFVVYAGQYQPDARATFDRAGPPEFVAVTGKARTFQPEDGDRVFSSVRPESVSVVDADTRDRWAVETARATLGRVGEMAAALQSGDHGDPTEGVALALEHYGTTPGYLAALRELATDAAGVVAGDRDEVAEFTADPDDDRPADLDALAALLDAVGDGREAATTHDAGGGGDGAGTGTTTSGDDLDTDTSTAAGGDETGADDTTDVGASADTGASESEAGAGGVGGEEIEEIDAGGEVESFDADDDEGFEVSGDVGETSTGGDDDLGDFDAGDDLGDFDADESTDDGDFDADADGVGDFEPDEVGDDADAPAAGDDDLYEMDDDERERIESEYGTEFSTGTEVDAPGEADIDTPTPEETEASEGETGEPLEDDAEADDADDESESDEAEAEPDATEAGDDAEPGEIEDEPEEPEADEGEAEAEATDGADEAEAGAKQEQAEPGADDEEAEPEPADDAEEQEAEDADVDAVLMEQMRELDDGDGADREALVEAVVDATGADAAAVDDAIQDALMSGQCYEPGEDRLKPI